MIRLFLLMLMCRSVCSASNITGKFKSAILQVKESATFFNSFGTFAKTTFKLDEKLANRMPTIEKGLKTTLFTTLDPRVTKALSPQLLGKVANSAKKLLTFAAALGPIGAFASMVAAFIPSGPSEELLAIKDGFKEVNLRFDKLELHLETLGSEARKRNAFNKYNELKSTFNALETKFKLLLKDVTDGAAKEAFANACETNYQDPISFISRLRDLILGLHNATDHDPLIEVILEDAKYNISKVEEHFSTIMTLLINAAKMTEMCLSLQRNDSHSFRREVALMTEERSNAMKEKLAISIKELKMKALAEQLDKDMRKELNTSAATSDANVVVHIKEFLDSKYSWLRWNVYIINQGKRAEFWRPYRQNSRVYWANETTGERHMMVTWVDEDRYEYMKEFLENARDYLDGRLENIDCSHLRNIEKFKIVLHILLYPAAELNIPRNIDRSRFAIVDTAVITEVKDINFVASDNTMYYRLCKYFIAFSVV